MLTIFILLSVFKFVVPIELTFELPDNANQCFFEEIKAGVDAVIEFQLLSMDTGSVRHSDGNAFLYFSTIVHGIRDLFFSSEVITGGKYDVDMTLEDESGNVLYKGVKKQYDTFSWKTDKEQTYKACFSNEFSTFSHKIVYMDWQKGEGDLAKATSRIVAMTQLESSAAAIGDRLKLIDDYQTHHRLREATGRKRAEDLSERVMWWSMGQTVVIIGIGIAQVILLRSFFTDKRSRY